MATETLAKQSMAPSKGLNVLLWVIQIFGAFMYFMAGFNKITSQPEVVGMFEKIGLGQWFRYFVGTIEIASAVLLLNPRFSVVGASLLVLLMIGAVFTHLFVIGGSPLLAIILLVLMAIVAFGRREQWTNFKTQA